MADKLPSLLESGDSQRGQSGKDHLSESCAVSSLPARVHYFLFSPPLTFLKMMGSSSHTGLMALLFWEVLVLRAFLLVSAGSPNISTSTYTPTRRSVKNWPEITCKIHRVVKNTGVDGDVYENKKKNKPYPNLKENINYFKVLVHHSYLNVFITFKFQFYSNILLATQFLSFLSFLS